MIQAKEMLPHGEWQNWLVDNFKLTERTARRFMQIADRFGKTVDVDRFQGSQLTELLALPEAESEQFIEVKTAEGNPVEYNSLRKISQDWHTGNNDYRPFIKYLLKIILRAYRELDERIELVEEKLSAYEMVKTVVEK